MESFKSLFFYLEKVGDVIRDSPSPRSGDEIRDLRFKGLCLFDLSVLYTLGFAGVSLLLTPFFPLYSHHLFNLFGSLSIISYTKKETKMNKVFSYFELSLRLRNEMLGTCASTNIYKEHIINKSREMIKLANKSQKKISKNLKKFVGVEISEEKEIEELKGILRAQQELICVKEDIPETIEEILEYARDLEARVDDYLQDKELAKSTVFLRDEGGNVGISSHMILGFMKSVMANIINSGNKSILKSKVQMGEAMSMDIKFLETFLMSSFDILRDPKSKERILNIRPIRFQGPMGKSISALAASEQIPAGATFSTVMRVRKDSNLNDIEVLKFILQHGKSIGLGAYRNSSHFGQFDYKINLIKNYVEVIEGSSDGWE